MVSTAGRRVGRERGIVWIGTVVAGLFLAAAVFAVVDVLANLHAMNRTLGSVAGRLTKLDDMSRKLEMHMPSDRPGMLMRQRLNALLEAHGEHEVPR